MDVVSSATMLGQLALLVTLVVSVACTVELPTATPASWERVYRGCPVGTHPCDALSTVIRHSCGRCCGVSHGRVECSSARMRTCEERQQCIISNKTFGNLSKNSDYFYLTV